MVALDVAGVARRPRDAVVIIRPDSLAVCAEQDIVGRTVGRVLLPAGHVLDRSGVAVLGRVEDRVLSSERIAGSRVSSGVDVYIARELVASEYILRPRSHRSFLLRRGRGRGRFRHSDVSGRALPKVVMKGVVDVDLDAIRAGDVVDALIENGVLVGNHTARPRACLPPQESTGGNLCDDSGLWSSPVNDLRVAVEPDSLLADDRSCALQVGPDGAVVLTHSGVEVSTEEDGPPL